MPEPVTTREPAQVLGWDIGGAHVKAAWWRPDAPDGAPRITAVMQVACPLWQGLEHLDAAVATVFTAWPEARRAMQAMTMTGELADGFEHREAGVQAIAQRMAQRTGAGEALRVFAGADDQARPCWLPPSQAASHWPQIASANWLATALAVARALPPGVDEALLVDIGSTTSDLIPVHARHGVTPGASDADRLTSGALVYHGVVRTPLCAFGTRVRWRGSVMNVMHEFFATSADVYRLTGELDPAHDQYPSADQGPKDIPGSRQSHRAHGRAGRPRWQRGRLAGAGAGVARAATGGVAFQCPPSDRRRVIAARHTAGGCGLWRLPGAGAGRTSRLPCDPGGRAVAGGSSGPRLAEGGRPQRRRGLAGGAADH